MAWVSCLSRRSQIPPCLYFPRPPIVQLAHREHRISQFARPSVPHSAFRHARQPAPISPPCRVQSRRVLQRRPWPCSGFLHSQTPLDLSQASLIVVSEKGSLSSFLRRSFQRNFDWLPADWRHLIPLAQRDLGRLLARRFVDSALHNHFARCEGFFCHDSTPL